MDERNNGLWQGGPWEQPSPAFPAPPAVRIPSGAMSPRRSVLRPRRRRRAWLLAPLLVLAAVLLGLLAWSLRGGFSVSFRGGSPYAGAGPREERQEYGAGAPEIPRAPTGAGVTVTLAPPGISQLSYAQIYEKNACSVVSIEALLEDGYSTGTGIILTQDGYIVTNAHMLAGGRSVRVDLADNSVLDARLVGFDAAEDLAVLKVEAQGLTPAEFGDSSELKIGDPVAALGDALGYRATFTEGIVSALDREIDVDGKTMALIQTSAAINFGNSGGALLNRYGQVVGITSVKIIAEDGSAEAMGFAIPSRRVKYVVEALIDGREVRTGVFGFTVYAFPAQGGGLELKEVSRHSDAWAKGLRGGDVVTAANGRPVSSIQDLTRIKQDLGPGDAVEITFRRDGQEFTVSVELVDAALID